MQRDQVSNKRRAASIEESQTSKRPVLERYVRDGDTLRFSLPVASTSDNTATQTQNDNSKTVFDISSREEAMETDSEDDRVSLASPNILLSSMTSVSERYSFESGTTEPVTFLDEEMVLDGPTTLLPMDSDTLASESIKWGDRVDIRSRVNHWIEDTQALSEERENRIKNLSSLLVPFQQMSTEAEELEPMFQFGALFGIIMRSAEKCPSDRSCV
ncbi:hypothetical protein TWF718_001533 [Orbilia javanica]|uniref:Uncharacterized protein n=1 Tax=Orbilia javanica TaxID=47235 RepID=A0AAN8RH68_9PEZI